MLTAIYDYIDDITRYCKYEIESEQYIQTVINNITDDNIEQALKELLQELEINFISGDKFFNKAFLNPTLIRCHRIDPSTKKIHMVHSDINKIMKKKVAIITLYYKCIRSSSSNSSSSSNNLINFL